MLVLKTYRAWFRDDSAMLVCAIDEASAKFEAERKSAEYHADAYFGTSRERNQRTKVKSIENLDD